MDITRSPAGNLHWYLWHPNLPCLWCDCIAAAWKLYLSYNYNPGKSLTQLIYMCVFLLASRAPIKSCLHCAKQHSIELGLLPGQRRLISINPILLCYSQPSFTSQKIIALHSTDSPAQSARHRITVAWGSCSGVSRRRLKLVAFIAPKLQAVLCQNWFMPYIHLFLCNGICVSSVFY